jgi:hypothetical protein
MKPHGPWSQCLAVLLVSLGSVLGASCSGKPSTATTPLMIENNSKATALPPAPPFARPGERMVFRIALQHVEVAAFNISVGEVIDLDGKKALVVQARAQSIGLASLVSKVDDQFASWVDVSNGRPLLFRSHEGEGNGGSDGVEDAATQFSKRTETMVPVVIKGKTIGEKSESQLLGDAELWDMNSFFLVLRGWQGEVGSKITSDVVRSRLVGKDSQVTAMGKLPTLRFNGVARKLERDGKEVLGDDRNFSLWITDDADRVPVTIVAKTDYGDVRMEIVEYSPGTGARFADGALAGE